MLGSLGGGQRGAAAPGAVLPAGQTGGQRGDGGRLEERPDRQLDVERGAHTADEPGGEQRVAAEGEEVVVDAYGRQAEDLGEEVGEDLLVRRARRAVLGDRQVRGGQGAAVQLAVDGQRQRVQDQVGGRDHVLGQPLGEVGAQLLGRHVPGGDDVADQALHARRVLADHDGDLPDGGVGAERGLDLAGFDAEAAQLDLLVGAARVLQQPAAVPAGQVTGAVHALTAGAMRVGDEALRRQRRAVEVAARQARAREVQLTHTAHRDRPQAVVQHVGAHAVERAPDGERALGGPRHRVGGGEGRRLGRAVAVHHSQSGAGVQDTGDRDGRDHVATGPHLVDAVQAARLLLGDDGEQARRQPQRRHALLGHHAAERSRRQLAGRRDDHAAAVEQRDPQLERRGVERVRRVHQHPLERRRPGVAGVRRQRDHVPLRHGHALGPAR
ncbi:hypothetical protein KAURM247S_07971 [Kitasatospora aureofaciens]